MVSFLLLRSRFLEVSTSEFLICAGEKQLPPPTTNNNYFGTSVLDFGNLIFAMVRIWNVCLHNKQIFWFYAYIRSNSTCSDTRIWR